MLTCKAAEAEAGRGKGKGNDNEDGLGAKLFGTKGVAAPVRYAGL